MPPKFSPEERRERRAARVRAYRARKRAEREASGEAKRRKARAPIDGPIRIEDHVGLVHDFIRRRKLAERGVDYDDLVQAGLMGLMIAAERFDASRGFKFATYAIHWIRHGVMRTIANHGRLVRVPVCTLARANKVKHARRKHAQRTGKEPTDAELARETALPLHIVKTALAVPPPSTFSLDRPIGEAGGRTFGDFVGDERPIADAQLDAAQTRATVPELLAVLTPQERHILTHRMGLEGADELTLNELGAQIGRSRERVRQIENQALGKIRARLREL